MRKDGDEGNDGGSVGDVVGVSEAMLGNVVSKGDIDGLNEAMVGSLGNRLSNRGDGVEGVSNGDVIGVDGVR